MRLYIIRHADPDYENETLTPAGHQEAGALARRLAQHGLDYIYTSPLARARLTADYTVNLVKRPPVSEAWLIEIPGWEIEALGGIPAWDIPGEVLRAAEPFATHDTWHALPFLGDERFTSYWRDFKEQSDALMRRHGYERDGGRYRQVRANRDQIAIFCHNGTALALLAHLLEIPLPAVWSGFWHAPSAVTTVLFEERSDTWAVPRCLSACDVSHLYAERLPVQPRGIRGNYR
ncbi:MAG: histidine phosphatase family protein [Trueperaceae bacterium]|nr:MAG: histidine phosphatase family protein [Trueperaceae bacterium]